MKLRKVLELGSIFYNEKYLEVILCNVLGILYNNETQGPDAFENGDWVELKITNKNEEGKFGSFQFHWLSKNKLDKYKKTKYIYFVFRDGIKFLKIYKMNMADFYPYLEEKAKRDGTYLLEETKINSHLSISSEKKLIELGAIKIYG